MTMRRRRIDVNLDELDRIIDRGTRAPMSEADGQKLKTVRHAMAERLWWKRSREKTAAVVEQPATPVGGHPPGQPASAGHGRHGAAEFTGAHRVSISHATLHSGDRCPECGKGKVYRQKEPATLIRLVGRALLEAAVYEMERLRCNARGEVFTAEEPEAAGEEKYDETAVAMIALFFTGWKHAGENIAGVLKQRARDLPAPIRMSDALSRNRPKLEGVKTLEANCRAHGRRQFVDVVENFPEECRYVLETLRGVYHNDALSRERELSPQDRLRFHQEHSRPWMDGLHEWMEAQFAEHKTEPNSGLGKAISYLLNRGPKLTLFLEQPGAPLDNNIVERALKKAILNRKNALFYKTLNGANPFDYLTALLRHVEERKQNPSEWMPWNYRETLARLALPAAA